MHLIRRLLLLTCVPVLAAGCGGVSKTASSQTTSTAAQPASTPAPTTTSRTSRTTGASAGGSTSAPTTPLAGSGGAGLPGASSGAGSSGNPAGGSVAAHIPAHFTLRADGTLDPQTVAAPAFVAIAVDVRSSASTPQTVTIGLPSPVVLHIPPHGRARTTVHGLRAGHYTVRVGTARRGALLVGAEPGP